MTSSPVSLSLNGGSSGILVLVGSTEDNARRIESHLRNKAHPIRVAWLPDHEEVEDLLKRNPPDVLLYYMGLAGVDGLIRSAIELRPELPVLVLTDKPKLEQQLLAMAAGARDVVCADDLSLLRHLELVVIREFVNHFNIRHLRVLRDRLNDFESRHQQLLEGTADAICHVREGVISHVNPAFVELLGFAEAGELVDQTIMDIVISEQQVRVKERLRSLLKGKHNGDPLEVTFQGKDKPVEVKAQLILGNQDGEKIIEMLIRSEATVVTVEVPVEVPVEVLVTPELPAIEVVSPAQANNANRGRAAFLSLLSDKPEAEGKVRAALFFVVDGFIALEERLGLTDAEQAVEELQKSLQQRLAPDDALFQFSGSELAMLVSRSQVAEIEALGQMLHRELTMQVFTLSAHEAQLSLSMVVYPLSGEETPEQVLRDMVRETRSLSAKGGNRTLVMGEAAKNSQAEREEAKKAATVRKAMEDNRLKVVYQSIASLEGDPRDHFDVLVRMVDEQGKEFHASEFLPAAERFGLMRNIDRLVTGKILLNIAKRAQSKDERAFLVRLSEDTVKDSESYIQWLQEALKKQPIRLEELILVIQETCLHNHIRKCKSLIEQIKSLGVQIAIDKFGQAQNSIQVMETFEVSFLKLDAAFTQKFNDKEMNRRMMQIMEIAKQKNIKTIVSHVEDANVMARLWQMGVNYIQGYHIQEPDIIQMASDVGR